MGLTQIVLYLVEDMLRENGGNYSNRRRMGLVCADRCCLDKRLESGSSSALALLGC